MKDFDGGEHYLGYTPLGMGKVDIPGLCDLLESSGNDIMIMGGTGSVEGPAAHPARGRTNQQGNASEGRVHVPDDLNQRRE